jgi:hypothetical protein
MAVAYDIKLQPLFASHMAILKQIDCPVFRDTIKADEKVTFTGEETVELIHALTTHPTKLRAALRKGRDVFNEEAHAAISDRLPFAVVRQMQQQAVDYLAAKVAEIQSAIA